MLAKWDEAGKMRRMDANETVVDARGLTCPLPVLRARKAFRSLQPGESMVVLATDPAVVQDMAAYCAQPGKDLVSSGREEDVFRFVIRRTAA